MDFYYGISQFERDRGSFPALPLINLVTEQVETEDSPSLQSRPGLEETGVTLGSGPVRALYEIDGTLSGQRFAISGSNAYEGTSNLGTVAGSGHAKIAGFESFVFFNAGAAVYRYNGSSFGTVSFPDGARVKSIAVGASRLLCIRENTGTFYYSDILNTNIGGLNFATAESSPDFLQDLLYVGDRLVLFGSKTVEFWEPTTDQDAPFQPVIGMVYPKGIKQTGACCEVMSTFAWVTDNNQLCIAEPDNIISPPDLNDKIAKSTTVRLWTFFIDGVEFLALTLDNRTYVYNVSTSLWSEFTSYGKDNWICRCWANGVFGSSEDGRILQWSEDYSDFGEELERRFRAWAPILNGNITLNSLHLRLAPGLTPFLTGPLSDPVAELRISDNGGFTWTSWAQRRMGVSGDYRKTVRWNSMGSYAFPGVLIEVRVTDPVPFRMSGFYANQPGGNV